jgi:glutamate/aspartate transport system permease protein
VNLDFGFFSASVFGSYVLGGLIFSVQLTLVAMLGGMALGTLLALMRLSGKPWLAQPAAAYINTMRSIPLVMVILWFFLLIPFAIGRPLGAEWSAILTFTLFEAAYYAEIMRAGIQSVPKGQSHAGYATGMSYSQVMRLVVLPQAVRNMLPVLLTQTIILFQDTSLVYVISATDFVGAASKIAQRDSRLVEMYLFVALVYFVLCYTLSLVFKRLQKKIAIVR